MYFCLETCISNSCFRICMFIGYAALSGDISCICMLSPTFRTFNKNEIIKSKDTNSQKNPHQNGIWTKERGEDAVSVS